MSFNLEACTDNISEISTRHCSVSTVHSIKQFIEGSRAVRDRRTRDLVVYAQWFLDTSDYIRELKSNFLSRIYQPILSSQQKRHTFSDVSKSERLSVIAENTSQLLLQLGMLFDWNENSAISEPTVDRVLDRKGISGQERSIIRLIPSSLRVLSELAALASDWLAVTSESRERTVTMGSHLDGKELRRELSRLTREIDNGERELELESEELHTLLEREERSNKINGENHTLEIKMNGYRDKLTEVRLQMKDTQELIDTTGNNSGFRNQLLNDLNAQRRQVVELEMKMKVLRYQMDIVVEDLCVELEIKPSLIRLTNSVQDKCMKLESSLEVKRLEKNRLEQTLRPIT